MPWPGLAEFRKILSGDFTHNSVYNGQYLMVAGAGRAALNRWLQAVGFRTQHGPVPLPCRHSDRFRVVTSFGPALLMNIGPALLMNNKRQWADCCPDA
jgi:hypothetical protein